MPKIAPFDAAKYLDSEEAIIAYLTEALEDPDFVAVAMRTIAHALDKLPPVPRAKIEARIYELIRQHVPNWVDPDVAPELTRGHFERADWYRGDRLVRRGRPPSLAARQPMRD